MASQRGTAWHADIIRTGRSALPCKHGIMHRVEVSDQICTCFSACWAWMMTGVVGDWLAGAITTKSSSELEEYGETSCNNNPPFEKLAGAVHIPAVRQRPAFAASPSLNSGIVWPLKSLGS